MNTKIILVFLLTLLLFQDTQAQKKKNRNERFHIGLEAEYGMTSVNYKGFPYQRDVARIATIGSFSGGLFAQIPIVRHLLIQPELLYSQCGYRRQVDHENGLESFDRRINYFEVPLSLKFTTGRFSIFAGPKLGFLNGAYKNIDESVAIAHTNEDFLYLKTTWSVLVGMEYTFHCGLGFQWRMSIGLNDIADHSVYNGYPASEQLQSNAVRFGIHYKF